MTDEEENLHEEMKSLDEFQTADEFETPEAKTEQGKEQIKNMIKKRWEQLVWIKTKCPSCGSVQKTQTDTTTKCFKCDSRYIIYPRGRRSRVVGVPEGKLRLLHEIRDLRTKGRFTSVL